MALLLDSDYKKLSEMGIRFTESEPSRFFIFQEYPLPDLYTVQRCDVLVIIPPNYNQAGNDMFWTYPRLVLKDGQQIPQTHDAGQSVNHKFENKEYCRWSRHWSEVQSAWKTGEDDILTIQRRIEWAFQHPMTK